MSSPSHHLPPDLLLEYAAGSADEARALFVATHLSWCGACRADLRDLEEAGGALLEQIEPEGGPDGFEALLDRLDEPAPVAAPPAVEVAPLPDGRPIPEPLRSYVARATGGWKTLIPGVAAELELPVGVDGIPARITRVRAGFGVPRHGHSGNELNLVLCGGYHDAGEGFKPGDVSERGEEDVHEIHIDPGEPCYILAVNAGRMVPRGLRSWLLVKLAGGY